MAVTVYPDFIPAAPWRSLREAARSVECPFCGEHSGARCRDRSGRAQQVSHSGRTREAQRLGHILEVPCQGEGCPNHG